ncbi:hypothetical protein [Chitinophaga agri]|uniref:DNA-directed DNA polymerase X domain-containing protein n=1 Tax=Chitinophaga agri TaxID=2703787 RepID=A0A6B9Z9X1_9BACT|nr:hypothetical protein [Chitinophaga agri]QHS58154.1 hypothetical protein GWR21_00650 [Chitinophaga agri]
MTTVIPNTQLPRTRVAFCEIYHKMAACYRYMGRSAMARSYEEMAVKAARITNDGNGMISLSGIRQLPDPGDKPDMLTRDLIEFETSGTLKRYVRLLQRVPAALLGLLDVKSISASLVRKLHEELDISTVDQLKAVILSGELKRVRGFSQAKIGLLKRSLKLYKTSGSRLLLWDAILQGNELLRVVRLIPEVEEASLTGSLRRGGETVGDIDMVVSVALTDRPAFLKHVLEIPQIREVVVACWNMVSVVLYNNTQVDIRVADEYSYGAALMYYTGSLRHLAMLNERAEKKGMHLSAMGLFNDSGAWVAGDTEDSIFKKLALSYIPPELREGGREVFRAGRELLPDLVTFSHINGDMRVQTNFGHGEESLETIAHYVINAFPHYEYVVVSDELSADAYPGQFEYIDRVNETIGFSYIKKGIVVQMNNHGALDISDDLLRQADWVTAIITDRHPAHYRKQFIMACDHPLINCIANPAGRVIGVYEDSVQNWDQLFRNAVRTGTALELNAQPQHLDLSDRLLKGATEKGVKIVINSCAQICSHYDYMQMGVIMARRGWCSKAHILNTGHWDDVQRFKKQHSMMHKSYSHEKDITDF